MYQEANNKTIVLLSAGHSAACKACSDTCGPCLLWEGSWAAAKEYALLCLTDLSCIKKENWVGICCCDCFICPSLCDYHRKKKGVAFRVGCDYQWWCGLLLPARLGQSFWLLCPHVGHPPIPRCRWAETSKNKLIKEWTGRFFFFILVTQKYSPLLHGISTCIRKV